MNNSEEVAEKECAMCSNVGPGMTILTDTEGKCLDCKKPLREVYKEPEKQKRELQHYDTTRAVAEPFEDYFNKHIDTIKKIQVIMETKLSDDPEILVNQLTDSESYGTKAKAMEAFANSYLDLAERQRLVPYDRSSYTDTDRTIELASACARGRRFRDICTGLVSGIERRISLGQSLLRYHESRLRQGA